ncbi:hypothetical protein HDU98_011414, partial [Podochytrium sp. JEL0797]
MPELSHPRCQTVRRLPSFSQALGSYRDGVNPEAQEVALSESVTVSNMDVQEDEAAATNEPIVTTLMATFPICYSDPDKKFFTEVRPNELEGLITSQDFHHRMHSLNLALGHLSTLKDFSAVSRTALILVIPVAAVLFFFLEMDSATMLVWTGGVALIFIFVIVSYFRDGDVHKILFHHI